MKCGNFCTHAREGWVYCPVEERTVPAGQEVCCGVEDIERRIKQSQYSLETHMEIVECERVIGCQLATLLQKRKALPEQD